MPLVGKISIQTNKQQFSDDTKRNKKQGKDANAAKKHRQEAAKKNKCEQRSRFVGAKLLAVTDNVTSDAFMDPVAAIFTLQATGAVEFGADEIVRVNLGLPLVVNRLLLPPRLEWVFLGESPGGFPITGRGGR